MDEKVQILGEEVIKLNDRVTKFISVVQAIYDRLDAHLGEEHIRTWNQHDLTQLRNEVTYLHNRVNELEKVTGLDGSRRRSVKKYEYT